MAVNYFYPEYEVKRDKDRCISCRVCERQCANEVHSYSEKLGVMISDESKCVNCQRCVCLCPTHALKIVKSDCMLKENANWQQDTIKEIYKQAGSGGVLLSSMGNPKPMPVYWDKILINASQVTNPPIDPLREPMETKVFLGKKPLGIKDISELPPQLELSMPVMFSAMSYGSISYNAHASLARAAQALGIYYNTGEGGLHEDFYVYGDNTVVQVASGRFGVHEGFLKAGAAVEIKMGQGAKPGIGGHLPGAKIVGDVSRTRMIPEGSDAISPAPHHDIYSIEDLRQLVCSLKEATEYKKPIIVKVAAVHNIAAIARSYSSDQYSRGINDAISCSRSTIILVATDCTRPADSPLLTVFQRKGESLYPTILSRMRLVCCAFTRSMSMPRGFFIPALTAVFVTSLKVILLASSGAMPRMVARCHDIASPSRSGSVAKNILSAFLASFFKAFITSPFPCILIYFGSNPFSMSTPSVLFGRSRTCPTVATTL